MLSTGFYINKMSPTQSYDYTVDNCTFYNNTANYGGTIYGSTRIAKMKLTIENSSFEKNSVIKDKEATADGGCIAFAMSFLNDVTISIINNNFTKNSAESNGGVFYYSSGLQTGDITISKNIFSHSKAENGGALYLTNV